MVFFFTSWSTLYLFFPFCKDALFQQFQQMLLPPWFWWDHFWAALIFNAVWPISTAKMHLSLLHVTALHPEQHFHFWSSRFTINFPPQEVKKTTDTSIYKCTIYLYLSLPLSLSLSIYIYKNPNFS